MLSVESDTEFGAQQLPLCDTALAEEGSPTIGCSSGVGGGGGGRDGTETGDARGVHDERREDVAVLTSQDGVCGQKSINANRPEYKAKSWWQQLRKCCRFRQGAVLLLGVFLTILALTLVVVGGVKSRQHMGVHLVHMQTPVNLKSLMYLGDENFTFVQLMALTNVALDRPANQSSTFSPEAEVKDEAIRAVDGNLSSCAVTGLERKPQWRLDLQRHRAVKSIRIHGASNFSLRNLVIYVTSSNVTSRNTVCGRVGALAKGYYTHMRCPGKTKGRYVVIDLENPDDSFESMRLCEVMVFSGTNT